MENLPQFFEVEEPAAVVIPPSDKKKSKTVSFSQYSKWMKCPMDWKLSYIDNLSPYQSSINTIFGNAIHEAIQEYLRLLYGPGGASVADSLDYMAVFNKTFDGEIAKDLKIATEEQLTLTPEEQLNLPSEDQKKLISEKLDSLGVISKEEIESFRADGVAILEHVTNPTIRKKHFPSKMYEVVGIELPIEIPMRGGAITYKGFLDIVLKDRTTKKFLILDFKTSTYGWNKYQKADRTKVDQLLLYKRFYHQQYNIPIEDIQIEFFVVKRKLYEDVAFPQQRIQRIMPASGKMSMKEVETTFIDFINNCFTTGGEKNKNGKFFKNPGKARKNCKYCVFKELKDKYGRLYCDGKEN